MNTLEINSLFHDRYRLLEQKGTGSFGEVWLARDEQLDLEVALKIYVALDDRGIEEFREEFKTAWTLNHPNLLHAYYYDVDDRRPFLVMPYCPGKAEELVGTTDETEIWKFIRDVSSGLAYIHDKDIVHHDIKPDNILKSAEGTYMITDFGISQRMRSTLRRNSTRQIGNSTEIGGGSLPYMAPEMFSGMPEAVKATDIWALGVTLFEIVTGDLPFFGQGGGMQLHGAELPQIKTNFSDDLKSIITACLQKDTWDRPTAQQLYDCSMAHLEGQKVEMPWNNNSMRKTAQSKKRQKKNSIKNLRSIKNGNKRRSPKLAPTCIWIFTICSLTLSVLFIVFSCGYDYADIVTALTESIIFIGSIILLRKSKVGFWIVAITQLIGAIWYCSILYSVPNYNDYFLIEQIAGPGFLTAAVIIVPMLYLILKKSKNEKYAWDRLNRRFPIAMIIIAPCVLLMVSIFSCKEYIEAYRNLSAYNSIVENCHQLIKEANINNDYLSDAQDKFKDIKQYENRYGSYLKKYHDYSTIYSEYKKKKDEIDKIITNNLKIHEVKFGASGANEKVSSYYNSLVAYEIKYLRPRVSYEWSSDETKEITLYVKIFMPDGSLEFGNSSPNGFTYSDNITLSSEEKYIYLSGWGNDEGGTYFPGTYSIELWYNDVKLYKQNFTLTYPTTSSASNSPISSNDIINISNMDFSSSNIQSYVSDDCVISTMPTLHYYGISNSTHDIYVYIKIFRPDGRLEKGAYYSYGEYTDKEMLIVHSGFNTCNLYLTWKNSYGRKFMNGKYKIEIWYERKKIYEQYFTPKN